MKQLFCVVVTDPLGVLCLESPIIYHVECDSQEQANDFVIADLSLQYFPEEDYGPDQEDVYALDVFAYPVTTESINKI